VAFFPFASTLLLVNPDLIDKVEVNPTLVKFSPAADFLENHVKTTASIDFFRVPTIRFQVLYVSLVLAHDRRRR
jgi:hypothetical protein